MMNAAEISKRLSERAEAFTRYLLPNGKLIGSEWCVGSLSGEEGKSLKVVLKGDKKGVWCDFATNESGDLLILIALNRNLTIMKSIQIAKQWLGVPQCDFVAHRPNSFVKPIVKKLPESENNTSGFNYLCEVRLLTPESIEVFDIRTTDKEISFPYWRDDELLQIKTLGVARPNGKKVIRVEKDCEPCLFGWKAMSPSARTVVLTEGEVDAMTVHQCGLPALSLPFGGGGGKKHQWLEYEFDRLSTFDEIYLCFDQDDAGQQAVNDLIARLGLHRCRVVELPYKDANECWQKGIKPEVLKQIILDAKSLDPAELKSAHIFADKVIAGFAGDLDNMAGISPPWEKAKGKIAFREGELSLWTGINGHGKSQFLGHIMLHHMGAGHRVCIASLELKPERLLMRLTRQAGALREPTPDYVRAIHEWYQDKLWIFDVTGNTKRERLLEVFTYAYQRYGINIFVIDSMMKCGMAEDDYNAHKDFVEQLCDFKNQHGCHIHLVTHPRKGADETKAPNKLDIKGSGAISDLADNVFTVWRNKAKEQVIQCGKASEADLDKPDCLWICDKQRNGEWEGKLALWFDANSFQYLGFTKNKPHRFVEYSKLQGENEGEK
jgi:twinkle protein